MNASEHDHSVTTAHVEAYPGQFRLPPDNLHIAVPRTEILAAMRHCGEEATVDHVCMAVAVVVDALETARTS